MSTASSVHWLMQYLCLVLKATAQSWPIKLGGFTAAPLGTL